MNENDLALFLDSLERCMKNDRFISIFYDIFLSSSCEIPAFFADTNFSRQRRILKSALYETITVTVRRIADLSALSGLSRRHQALQIEPRHYDLWIQSLISAVERCDPHYDRDVGRVWREAFQPAIDYMKDGNNG